MEFFEVAATLAPWATPAITIALFAWLRSDIRSLGKKQDENTDKLDTRLRAVETGMGKIEGQLLMIRDYMSGRNQRAEAAGDD